MSPEYLKELADIADPEKLWRLPLLDQLELPASKRKQLDTGVALRRYSSDLKDMAYALANAKSILITPFSANGRATKVIETRNKEYKKRQEDYLKSISPQS